MSSCLTGLFRDCQGRGGEVELVKCKLKREDEPLRGGEVELVKFKLKREVEPLPLLSHVTKVLCDSSAQNEVQSLLSKTANIYHCESKL